MKVREEEIGRLKNSNAVLIEELKEVKKVRRNSEIDKFQNILAEKMNVELESGVTRRLSNYAEEMKRKVKMLERNLSCEFSDEADSLRDELKKINEKIGNFLEKSNRKTFENKVFLQEESSVFHNKIKEIPLPSKPFLLLSYYEKLNIPLEEILYFQKFLYYFSLKNYQFFH